MRTGKAFDTADLKHNGGKCAPYCTWDGRDQSSWAVRVGNSCCSKTGCNCRDMKTGRAFNTEYAKHNGGKCAKFAPTNECLPGERAQGGCCAASAFECLPAGLVQSWLRFSAALRESKPIFKNELVEFHTSVRREVLRRRCVAYYNKLAPAQRPLFYQYLQDNHRENPPLNFDLGSLLKKTPPGAKPEDDFIKQFKEQDEYNKSQNNWFLDYVKRSITTPVALTAAPGIDLGCNDKPNNDFFAVMSGGISLITDAIGGNDGKCTPPNPRNRTKRYVRPTCAFPAAAAFPSCAYPPDPDAGTFRINPKLSF